MSTRDQGLLCGRGPPYDGRPGPTGRTAARRWWASGARLITTLALVVLYPGALGAHGLHPAPVTTGGAPVMAAAATPSHYQLDQSDQAAELFCHNPVSEPGEGGHGGGRYKCVLCPVLCGGGGGPALLPPEGAPPLHRSAATRRHGSPPPAAAVVTRPHPVASGGGPRAPPLDS